MVHRPFQSPLLWSIIPTKGSVTSARTLSQLGQAWKACKKPKWSKRRAESRPDDGWRVSDAWESVADECKKSVLYSWLSEERWPSNEFHKAASNYYWSHWARGSRWNKLWKHRICISRAHFAKMHFGNWSLKAVGHMLRKYQHFCGRLPSVICSNYCICALKGNLAAENKEQITQRHHTKLKSEATQSNIFSALILTSCKLLHLIRIHVKESKSIYKFE